MLENIRNKDLKTLGYVLKRTNYGEFDRILNILTPHGKISAIAKGVRKEKSKLAGGIEMFTLSEFNIHFGNNELGVVTGAKMKKYHSGIIKDLTKMELAATILKRANKLSEGSDSPDYFDLVDQSFLAISEGERTDIVEAWFLIKTKKIMGEEMNLYRDVDGKKLDSDQRYDWNNMDLAFYINPNGEYGADEIKLLRLMVANDLNLVRRVKIKNEMIDPILRLARQVV